MRDQCGAVAVLLAGAACAAPVPNAAPPTETATPALAVAVAEAPPDFRALEGLDEAAVRRLLGMPDFHRREPPGQVWQYRSADCVLDIFLYRKAGAYRVVHAETRDRGIARISQSGCYASLVTAHEGLRQSRFLETPRQPSEIPGQRPVTPPIGTQALPSNLTR